MSRFPNEYDDGYDGREAFERADEDRPEDMEDPDDLQGRHEYEGSLMSTLQAPHDFDPNDSTPIGHAFEARAVVPPICTADAMKSRPILNLLPREHYFTLDEWVHAGRNMKLRGGSFASAIGEAVIRADSHNSARLCFVFEDLIRSYIPTEKEIPE